MFVDFVGHFFYHELPFPETCHKKKLKTLINMKCEMNQNIKKQTVLFFFFKTKKRNYIKLSTIKSQSKIQNWKIIRINTLCIYKGIKHFYCTKKYQMYRN